MFLAPSWYCGRISLRVLFKVGSCIWISINKKNCIHYLHHLEPCQIDVHYLHQIASSILNWFFCCLRDYLLPPDCIVFFQVMRLSVLSFFPQCQVILPFKYSLIWNDEDLGAVDVVWMCSSNFGSCFQDYCLCWTDSRMHLTGQWGNVHSGIALWTVRLLFVFFFGVCCVCMVVTCSLFFVFLCAVLIRSSSW